MAIFIDLHLLQTVPPSNLNRDDTGSPKTAMFGGVRRARVSSQAWKRAIRKDFDNAFEPHDLGERTLTVAASVASKITELEPQLAEQANELAVQALRTAGIKISDKEIKSGGETVTRAQTGALLFASRPQIEALARLAIEKRGDLTKKEAQQALRDGTTVDVALFGRMIADTPELNVDACCQVAHALSVHPVDNEYDYFTAVDDNALETNAGAGMIGTVEFNSATLYRYATINATEFSRLLGSVEVARRGVAEFVRSFVTSMPTGKQNTFANRTLPDLAMLIVRDDQPVNLVGAFEVPIRSAEGRVREAAQKLLDRQAEIEAAFETSPTQKIAVAVGEAKAPVEQAGVQLVTISDLAEAAGAAVSAVEEA